MSQHGAGPPPVFFTPRSPRCAPFASRWTSLAASGGDAFDGTMTLGSCPPARVGLKPLSTHLFTTLLAKPSSPAPKNSISSYVQVTLRVTCASVPLIWSDELSM